jgi:hypothetical protein
VPNVTPRADNIANDVNVEVRHLGDDAICHAKELQPLYGARGKQESGVECRVSLCVFLPGLKMKGEFEKL